MVQRKDPLTSELFFPHRNNQIFANRKNQTTYNNLKARKIRQAKKPFENQIHRNFLILNEIMNGDAMEQIFHKQFLLGKGFKFNIATGVETINNQNFFTLFNYILIPTSNDQFKIRKK